MTGGFEEHSDLGLAVGCGDEGRFVLARREPDAGLEHGAVEASEGAMSEVEAVAKSVTG